MIRHLLANFPQTRGLLPNLQEGAILPEGRTFWLRTRTQERIRCDARWKKAPNWIPPVVEVEQVLQDWFQYWGHEHDYRNNLISVRWGGVVPREVPCNRKESETLRDGPFSDFRQSSSDHLEKDAARKTSSKSRRREKKGALPNVGVEVLEGQEGQADHASEATGARIDGQPITDEGRDEGGGADDMSNDTDSETEQDLSGDEDEFGEADDDAQPSRWQSDILCVADPFIRAKNLAGPIRPNMIVRFREDCQRAVMRLRMGGNLDALLRLDQRHGPPSQPPNPGRGRRHAPRRGMQDDSRGKGRNRPPQGPSRGGAPTTTGTK